VEVEMNKCSDPLSPLALVRQHHRKDDWPPDEWDGADFLHCFGSVEGALLYAALFVPELIEIEGCVFLKDLGAKPAGGVASLAEQIKHARTESPGTLRRFLESCNWVEVPFLFSNHSDNGDGSPTLAAVIVEVWRARLYDKYPDRRFKVRIISPEETGGWIGVGFVEEHNTI
jgi:hypothetical protein